MREKKKATHLGRSVNGNYLMDCHTIYEIYAHLFNRFGKRYDVLWRATDFLDVFRTAHNILPVIQPRDAEDSFGILVVSALDQFRGVHQELEGVPIAGKKSRRSDDGDVALLRG
jgi:hypothetical protein